MMQKPSVILLAFLLVSGSLLAQQTDFDMVVQPVDTKARDFSEYLVQLAWLNNPASAIAQTEVKKTQEEAKNTKKEWMRDVQATFNLNESNLRSPDSSNNVFFPRYNFGVNLNLFNVLSQKTKNKVSKREIEIAQHGVNQSKLELRAETLRRYATFKMAKQVYNTRTLLEQEMSANYILIQQLYKNDEKSFDEYTQSASAYYEAQESRIRAEADLQIAKLSLEEMIGLRWEQVQHPGKD